MNNNILDYVLVRFQADCADSISTVCADEIMRMGVVREIFRDTRHNDYGRETVRISYLDKQKYWQPYDTVFIQYKDKTVVQSQMKCIKKIYLKIKNNETRLDKFWKIKSELHLKFTL